LKMLMVSMKWCWCFLPSFLFSLSNLPSTPFSL
jgi:hypothetical protein